MEPRRLTLSTIRRTAQRKRVTPARPAHGTAENARSNRLSNDDAATAPDTQNVFAMPPGGRPYRDGSVCDGERVVWRDAYAAAAPLHALDSLRNGGNDGDAPRRNGPPDPRGI